MCAAPDIQPEKRPGATNPDKPAPHRTGTPFAPPAPLWLVRAAFALGVGALGGAAAFALGAAFDLASLWFARHPLMVAALPLVAAAEIALFQLLRVPPSTNMASVVWSARHGTALSAATACAVFATTCMSAACGASVGKEAAAVQVCAALACVLAGCAGAGKPKRALPVETGTAIACGMAAGFSGLLHAPVAGTLFALELVDGGRVPAFGLPHAGWQPPVSTPREQALRVALIAGSSLGACAVAVLLGTPTFLATSVNPLAQTAWDPAHTGLALLVAAAGVAAGLVYRRLMWLARMAAAHLRDYPYALPVVAGCLIAVAMVAFGLETFAGSGTYLAAQAFRGEAGAGDFLVKALLTVAALGFGIKGGEIMPALSIGALLGAAVAGLLGIPAALGAMLGMVAFFATALRCPLAACALGVELVLVGL